MIRWLLNTFPTWAIGVVVAGGFTVVAVLGQRIVHQRFPSLRDGEHNETAGVVLQVLLVMFGLVLAFTIVSLYEDMKAADTTAQEEGTLIALLYRDSRGFDPAVVSELDETLNAYVHEVVDVEWELMSRGESSARGWDLIGDIYSVLQSYEPETVAQQTFYSEAVGKLNDIAAARRLRIVESQAELPGAFMLLIVLGAVGLLLCMWMFGSPYPKAQLWITGGMAFLTGLNLLLVVLLDYPFAGDLAVSPQPYKEGALSAFW